jgi:hypothetical protein
LYVPLLLTAAQDLRTRAAMLIEGAGDEAVTLMR